VTAEHPALVVGLDDWRQRITAAKKTQWPLIDRYLRAVGCQRPYPALQPNGKPFLWCGSFAARCYEVALGLRPDVATLWASTYKIVRMFGQYQPDDNIPSPCIVALPDGGQQKITRYHAQNGGQRLCLPGRKEIPGLLPGDVLTCGVGAVGGHVALYVGPSPDGLGVRTLSGNGWGWFPGPDGEPDESKKVSGVVLADVPWASVAWAIRPAPADLDESLVLVRR